MDTGKNIKNLRSKRNMRAKELAQLAGITPTTLSKIEAGTRAITFEEGVRLAQVLGVNVADLYSGKNTTARERVYTAIGVDLPEQDAADLEKLTSTPEGRELLGELLSSYVAMPDDRRRALALLVKSN